MTREHINDMVEAQRRLTWAMAPAARQRLLENVRADYEYDALLCVVGAEMARIDAVDSGD